MSRVNQSESRSGSGSSRLAVGGGGLAPGLGTAAVGRMENDQEAAALLSLKIRWQSHTVQCILHCIELHDYSTLKLSLVSILGLDAAKRPRRL